MVEGGGGECNGSVVECLTEVTFCLSFFHLNSKNPH